jgi:hypothetical protein
MHRVWPLPYRRMHQWHEVLHSEIGQMTLALFVIGVINLISWLVLITDYRKRQQALLNAE